MWKNNAGLSEQIQTQNTLENLKKFFVGSTVDFFRQYLTYFSSQNVLWSNKGAVETSSDQATVRSKRLSDQTKVFSKRLSDQTKVRSKHPWSD